MKLSTTLMRDQLTINTLPTQTFNVAAIVTSYRPLLPLSPTELTL